MATMWSDHRTSNQQEPSVLFTHISLLTSSKGQLQEIITLEPVDGLQEPYLATLDLTTLENINIYNKKFFGLTKSHRYNLTRSKWTGFYQEL